VNYYLPDLVYHDIRMVSGQLKISVLNIGNLQMQDHTMKSAVDIWKQNILHINSFCLNLSVYVKNFVSFNYVTTHHTKINNVNTVHTVHES
jgi:hypothetical protein